MTGEHPVHGIHISHQLWFFGGLTLAFSISEMVVGAQMNSITLLSDGFHNLADAGTYGIAIITNRAQLAGGAESHRVGVMGGMATCTTTLTLTFFAGLEAFQRLFVNPHTKELAHIGTAYFVVAALGIALNGAAMFALGGHGHSHGGLPCHADQPPSVEDALTVEGCADAAHDGCHGHGHGHGHGHAHGHAKKDCCEQESLYQGSSTGSGRLQTSPSFQEEQLQRDMNIYALWLHTAQDVLGSIIVLICGLIVQFGGFPGARHADSVGGLIICTLVWITTVPVWVDGVRELSRRHYLPFSHDGGLGKRYDAAMG